MPAAAAAGIAVGTVRKGVDNTIDNVGRLGKVGMRQTDIEMLNMMIEN